MTFKLDRERCACR